MIKIPSLENITPDPSIISINQFFKDIIELVDNKFHRIDLCPLKKNKTLFCKHKKSCIHSLIIGFIKGFSKFFTIQLILNFISFLKEYYYNQNSFKNIFPNIFKKNVINMGFYLGIQNFIIRLITCSMRFWIQKNNSFVDLIAGFLAGLASYEFMNKSYSSTINFFIASRLCDTLFNQFKDKSKLTKNWLIKLLFYANLNMITGYAFAVEPNFCNKALVQVYHKLSCFDPNLFTFVQTWRKKMDNNFK